MVRFLCLSFAVVAACSIAAGCNDPDSGLLGSDGGGASMKTLSYEFTSLPALDAGYRYEAWLMEGGTPTSIGKFDIQSDGTPVPASVQVKASDLAASTALVVTLEPAGDTDPAPAQTKILAGDLDATGASLKVDHADALGTDFATATGKFMLSTPTTASDMADSKNGIWWIDPSSGSLQAGLALPTLPAGWKYESWVADASETVSTGKFVAVDQADEDLAGAAAGTDPPPPFPGNDFIDPPRDLTAGYEAALSIEPDPDPGAGAFAIKILRSDTITSDAIYDPATPKATAAGNIAASTLPKGTVTIQ